MNIGCLYYEPTGISVDERVKQLAGSYQERYGRRPNVCFVNQMLMQMLMLQTDEAKFMKTARKFSVRSL